MFRLRRQLNSTRVRILLTLASMLISAGLTHAQSSVFTYQGKLTDTGTAANGNYDFQFALSDALSGGTQIGSPLARPGVAVANGIFTVQLDFGASAFPGADRFIEIAVRVPGGASFTTLTPRQQINSAAYGIRSLKASSADTATNAVQLGGVAASQYVLTSDSRLSDPRPPTVGNSNYIQNTAVAQPSSNFNISGNGTSAGTLTGNIVNAATQYNINGIRVVSNSGGDNIFVGASAGQNNTTGILNSFFGSRAGQANDTYGGNSFFGADAGRFLSIGSGNTYIGSGAGQNGNNAFGNAFVGSASGVQNSGANNSFFGTLSGADHTVGSHNTFVGYSSGRDFPTGHFITLLGANADIGADGVTNATAIGSYAVAGQSNSLVLGSIAGVNSATASVNVGIGTTTPAAKLDIKSSGPTNIALQISMGGIKVAGAGVGTSTPVFIHRVTPGSITCLHCSRIDHPLTNGDPNAILIVTANFNPGGIGGIYNAHPISVYYEPALSSWLIFNQDFAAMPISASFNVLVVKP